MPSIDMDYHCSARVIVDTLDRVGQARTEREEATVVRYAERKPLVLMVAQ